MKTSMLFLAAFIAMLPRLSQAYSWSLGNAPTNGQWYSIAVSPRGDKMAVGDGNSRNGIWVLTATASSGTRAARRPMAVGRRWRFP